MGELARMPGAPNLPETPLELITPRPGEGFSLENWLRYPVLGAGVGAGFWMFRNRLLSRPIWAGIQYTVISAAICSYAATVLRDIRYAAAAESDAAIKHYISLHPEDFPPFERKRFKDVYFPFHPYR